MLTLDFLFFTRGLWSTYAAAVSVFVYIVATMRKHLTQPTLSTLDCCSNIIHAMAPGLLTLTILSVVGGATYYADHALFTPRQPIVRKTFGAIQNLHCFHYMWLNRPETPITRLLLCDCLSVWKCSLPPPWTLVNNCNHASVSWSVSSNGWESHHSY